MVFNAVAVGCGQTPVQISGDLHFRQVLGARLSHHVVGWATCGCLAKVSLLLLYGNLRRVCEISRMSYLSRASRVLVEVLCVSLRAGDKRERECARQLFRRFAMPADRPDSGGRA